MLTCLGGGSRTNVGGRLLHGSSERRRRQTAAGAAEAGRPSLAAAGVLSAPDVLPTIAMRGTLRREARVGGGSRRRTGRASKAALGELLE